VNSKGVWKLNIAYKEERVTLGFALARSAAAHTKSQAAQQSPSHRRRGDSDRHRCPPCSDHLLPPALGLTRRGAMSRSLSMRGSMRSRRDLPPPDKVRDPSPRLSPLPSFRSLLEPPASGERVRITASARVFRVGAVDLGVAYQLRRLRGTPPMVN
jgi:hypothetical protein